ncbi:MAG: GatB/YqeY domain-containing protein [Pseudomonadota bacterium]
MIRDQINNMLKTALKAQEKRKVSTLRLINAAIKDRDIAVRTSDREGVSDAEILEILAKMIKQRRESIQTYEEAGRLELAQQEQEEIDVITLFLPKQLTDNEIKAAVKQVISEINAQGLRDMGRIMGTLKERYMGQMDFSKASQIVKSEFA